MGIEGGSLQKGRIARLADQFVGNPWLSVISHTIFVAGVTAAAFMFIFDSNKVSAAQSERDMYKSKVETLEREIDTLNARNQQYLAWLEAEPKSLPALEREISRLNEQLVASGPKVEPNMSTANGRGATISVGETFVDPLTNASVGVMRLAPPAEANINLSLPGAETKKLEEVGPGQTWAFKFNGVPHQLRIESIDWYSNKITISVSQQ